MVEEIIIKNQPILSKILDKINRTNTNVQAYILYGHSKENLDIYSELFSKILICPKRYKEKCNECNICNKIKNNTFGELKKVDSINGIIKKESILEIINSFQTESIEGKNRVYIIKDVELLNQSAANTILKFLEEPESKTVAIFTTINLDAVISTIKSRCQIIKLNNNMAEKGIEAVIKQTNLTQEDIYMIIDFIRLLENDYSLAFSKLKEDFLNLFKSKEKLSSSIYVILLFYKDILSYKLNKTYLYFEKNDFINISEKQSIDTITKKIAFILENMNKLEYNINTTLFMDYLLIGIGELKND